MSEFCNLIGAHHPVHRNSLSIAKPPDPKVSFIAKPDLLWNVKLEHGTRARCVWSITPIWTSRGVIEFSVLFFIVPHPSESTFHLHPYYIIHTMEDPRPTPLFSTFLLLGPGKTQWNVRSQVIITPLTVSPSKQYSRCSHVYISTYIAIPED